MIPEWLRLAREEIGVKEVPGAGNNPRIVEYHSTTSLKATQDSVYWCSSFVNWCINQAGIKGTGSAAARSWLEWGIPLDKPRLGCIVVFKRGAPPSGHVAFCDHEDISNGIIRVINGNMSDEVKISRLSVNGVLGYRWPA
jgi:uncharacterized protein (TIGR02594 family)